jgi:sulfatase maturation enzyme AslB (radical SAM superfamily)
MGCIGFRAHPVWEMTTACNLRCIHCHASGGKPAANELTTEEAKRLLDQLAEMPEFRMMAYTGGEPLVAMTSLSHSRIAKHWDLPTHWRPTPRSLTMMWHAACVALEL